MNLHFWNAVLKKILSSPLDSKEIKPVNPEGNQSWIFMGRTHAEADAPILWPPDAKSRLTGKDSDAGKDWRQEKGWGGWVASLTQGTWVWANSRRWWRTGKPGVLQSIGLQRVGHDWVTSLLQIHSSNHFKSDARKDWRKKGTTEDEMVVWHHRLYGHELGQTPGDGEGQGNLACCSPWGLKVSNMT